MSKNSYDENMVQRYVTVKYEDGSEGPALARVSVWDTEPTTVYVCGPNMDWCNDIIRVDDFDTVEEAQECAERLRASSVIEYNVTSALRVEPNDK